MEQLREPSQWLHYFATIRHVFFSVFSQCGCLLSMVLMLTLQHNHVALYFGTCFFGLFMSSITPTALALAEQYIDVTCKYVCVSVSPSVRLSVCLCVCLFMSVYLSVYLSVCLSVCVSVCSCLSICLPPCLSVCVCLSAFT